MTALPNLSMVRQDLQLYFGEQAAQHGIEINPVTDVQLLDISELIYYEIGCSRKICIFFDPTSSLDLDWYIKDGDTESPEKLLAIFLNGRMRINPFLWDVYVEWMISEGDVETLFRNKGL